MRWAYCNGSLSMLNAVLPAANPAVPPPALLPVYTQFPLRPVRGRGSWLIDENGDEWLDAYGGHAVAAAGHCHPHRVPGIPDQAAELPVFSRAGPPPQPGELGEE